MSTYKVCFCDGDSCNARNIPDIADPEPEEVGHGEPDKTDGNAASKTLSIPAILSTLIVMVLTIIV